MTRKTKELIVGLLGVVGVVFLVLFLLLDRYDDFMLVIAVAMWLVSGLFARYWGVPKWSSDDR